MTNTEARLMELARRLCAKSTHHKVHIGAIIARKSRVIGVGHNQLKTHTQAPHPFKHIHAEVDATRGVPLEELRGASIYVYRTRLDGLMGMSKPCPTCHAYLRSLGLRRALYTTDSGIAQITL